MMTSFKEFEEILHCKYVTLTHNSNDTPEIENLKDYEPHKSKIWKDKIVLFKCSICTYRYVAPKLTQT